MSIVNLNFLVAEDSETQRTLLVRMLESLGAKSIRQAMDGHGALTILSDPATPVDIVISDLEMPGMDGMEFLRHIGESGIRVPIILASALERRLLASIETMSEAYGINLLGAVEKPITPGKLVPLIKVARPVHEVGTRFPRKADLTFTPEEVAGGLNNDEFEPFFQPKIELATGRVKGAEALARWRHPGKGLLAPGVFIQTLEDSDFIDELTWVILGKAAAYCSAWRNAGLDATVSVNLSLISLADIHFSDRVAEIVGGQNLDPGHMVLELTESAVATDVGRALENLARLRMKGFGLSIDDYGTGYSSMQQLVRIAFTELKIDRSFVANATKQESARVILESSLDMAKKLNITAVAEGVETQAGWDLLRQLGCGLAQGYFIARPMAAEAYQDWVRDWERSG